MLSVESEHSFYYITIPCLLESSDHVHTEASVHAIDLDQCQTDHPNLMAHLVLSTSLSNNIYIAPVGFSFFFLEFGRYRTVARSLHEHKLSKLHLYKDTEGP